MLEDLDQELDGGEDFGVGAKIVVVGNAIDHGVRASLRDRDALILAKRLTAWSEASVREDLAAYRDVDPVDALAVRDLLLGWLVGENRS